MDWPSLRVRAASCRGGRGELEDPVDQILEREAGGLGRLRQEAGVGQARDRVDLEHLRPGLLEDQVDP